MKSTYKEATDAIYSANSERAFRYIAKTFSSISGYKDADALAKQYLEMADSIKRTKETNEQKISNKLAKMRIMRNVSAIVFVADIILGFIVDIGDSSSISDSINFILEVIFVLDPILFCLSCGLIHHFKKKAEHLKWQ